MSVRARSVQLLGGLSLVLVGVNYSHLVISLGVVAVWVLLSQVSVMVLLRALNFVAFSHPIQLYYNLLLKSITILELRHFLTYLLEGMALIEAPELERTAGLFSQHDMASSVCFQSFKVDSGSLAKTTSCFILKFKSTIFNYNLDY